jgi:RNA polymerase subunit RPABC4/transcription elongation factor Spt4
MAIIKCPECGHPVSDKAPTCPTCGVEIVGKTITCANCGTTYFKDQALCPNCHCPNPLNAATSPLPSIQTATLSQESNSTQSTSEHESSTSEKKNNRFIWIISFVIALIICGTLYYFYHSASQQQEEEAYEYAMKSNDPDVLQSYLETYKDADQAHIDSIMSHLNMLKTLDTEWTNAIVSGSKEAIEAYLQKYPNSPYRQEAWNKIDSIDWQIAKKADTAEAYQTYLDEHTDGSHIEEAENAMKKAKSRDLQPEESQMVSSLFRKFFQSINTRNEDGLTATCEDVLSSLLGKPAATKSDVLTFMNKLYKEDITNMVWRINDDYQIKKREVGDEEYEYQVVFTARQEVSRNDGSTQEGNFKISATVSPDGKISAFNMARIEM